ncbi:MAG: hypothetical protein HZA51_08415 [Planctomycetes bacterium]|nr:hypothetical protein [Planctomycetota bacterium]
MNRLIDTLIFKSKSVLCICLMVGLHVMLPGCGQDAFAPANTVSTPLGDADALSQVLAGTPMAGARTIEFDQLTKNFRIVDENGNARINGQVSSDSSGDQYVSLITITNGGRSVTLSIDANKQITNLVTSQGVWQRPVTTNAPTAPGSATAPGARASSDVDQFVAANAELFSLARQADEQGYATMSVEGQPKAGAASLAPVLWVLGGLAFIPIGIAMSLLWIVEIVVILNVIF